MSTLWRSLSFACSIFTLGAEYLTWNCTFLNEVSDLVSNHIFDQVPLIGDADDTKWRRGFLLNTLFLRIIFFSSDEESDPDGRGNENAIATDFFIYAATSRLPFCAANYAVGANTTALVTIAFIIFKNTIVMVVTWKIADSDDSRILDSSLRIENGRLFRELLRCAPLINVPIWAASHVSSASITVLSVGIHFSIIQLLHFTSQKSIDDLVNMPTWYLIISK